MSDARHRFGKVRTDSTNPSRRLRPFNLPPGGERVAEEYGFVSPLDQQRKSNGTAKSRKVDWYRNHRPLFQLPNLEHSTSRQQTMAVAPAFQHFFEKVSNEHQGQSTSSSKSKSRPPMSEAYDAGRWARTKPKTSVNTHHWPSSDYFNLIGAVTPKSVGVSEDVRPHSRNGGPKRKVASNPYDNIPAKVDTGLGHFRSHKYRYLKKNANGLPVQYIRPLTPLQPPPKENPSIASSGVSEQSGGSRGSHRTPSEIQRGRDMKHPPRSPGREKNLGRKPSTPIELLLPPAFESASSKSLPFLTDGITHPSKNKDPNSRWPTAVAFGRTIRDRT